MVEPEHAAGSYNVRPFLVKFCNVLWPLILQFLWFFFQKWRYVFQICHSSFMMQCIMPLNEFGTLLYLYL